MKNRYVSVLTAVLLMVVAGLVPTNSNAVSLVAFSVHTPGDAPMIDGNGTYHMSTGIWNIIEVTLDSSVSDLTVEMQYGSAEQNWTNHYLWKYSGGVWEDPLYQYYIVPENCSVSGNTYLIYLGVDYGAYYGTWTVTISSEGSGIAVRTVILEAPRVAASFHSADFNLRAEPFVATTIDSKDYMQDFRVVNEGNVPLTYTINYSAYADRINTTGKVAIIEPGKDARHYIVFRTGVWSPRILSFDGSISATAAYRIPQRENTTHLIPTVASTFTAEIHIGHTNYEIYTDGDLSFQAKKKTSVDYDSISNLTVFLTGNGSAIIGIKGSDCKIREIVYEGENVSLPLQIELRPDSEKNISLSVLADRPDTTATIIYEISYKGKYHKYTTEMAVGPVPQEGVPGDINGAEAQNRITVVAFLMVLVGAAVAYMLFTQKRLAEEARMREERSDKKPKGRKKK